MKISILGTGAFGMALASVFHDNKCSIKPENFKENLNNLFTQGNDKILKNLNIIVDNLDVVLRKEKIDI